MQKKNASMNKKKSNEYKSTYRGKLKQKHIYTHNIFQLIKTYIYFGFCQVQPSIWCSVAYHKLYEKYFGLHWRKVKNKTSEPPAFVVN